ncbi:SLC37A1 family protein [Megaselia abdita]
MVNNYNIYYKMSNSMLPCGVQFIQYLASKCCPLLSFRKDIILKSLVLILTYVAYMCYHMTRKPISVVKSVLHRNCSGLIPPDDISANDTTWCDFQPFDTDDASKLFGALDSAFLFSYAIAMFMSGYVAERVSLRYFLSFGMILSGIFTYLFGIAKPSNIHNLWYFIIVQALAGICQTTGWPGVVTVVGRWFGKSKRGLIFGIWNSHTSIGNILGSLIAAYYVEKDWSLSFIYPGIIMAVVGFILFLFLIDSPDLMGPPERRHEFHSSDVESYEREDDEISYRSPTERTPILSRSASTSGHTSSGSIASHEKPISILDALYIPGVAEFSLCLFFSKLVSYTFLYWLPMYIQQSTTLGAELSADLSTIFDVGGIVGAITAGVISDYSGMHATTCTIMLFLAAPMLLLYNQFGSLSLITNIFFLFMAGILVNGPYALITTSVSAELGQHNSLEGNAKALATVTAIIDGTGSIGAAIGPLLAGMISSSSWQNVFTMLILSDVIAMLLLVRLVMKEFHKLKRNARIE